MAIARRQPIASVVGQRMTLEAFLKLPEEKPSLELVGGVARQKPLGQAQHAALQAGAYLLIDSYARPRRQARGFTELRMIVGQTFLVPDVAVIRWDRLPRLADGTLANDPIGAVDIAIEIKSPDQSIRDLIEKCELYRELGVEIVLLVHPERRWVRRFAAAGVSTLSGDDRLDLDSVLPGFELTVQQLFDTLRD